jgi:hypothetical protein
VSSRQTGGVSFQQQRREVWNLETVSCKLDSDLEPTRLTCHGPITAASSLDLRAVVARPPAISGRSCSLRRRRLRCFFLFARSWRSRAGQQAGSRDPESRRPNQSRRGEEDAEVLKARRRAAGGGVELCVRRALVRVRWRTGRLRARAVPGGELSR